MYVIYWLFFIALFPMVADANDYDSQIKVGETIFERACATCHRDGIMGAPKAKLASDWNVRTSKKTLDELTASVIKGLNAMPARGTCYECTNSEIKAAIQYMVPKS